jgi:AraC-like DNA-binding protein
VKQVRVCTDDWPEHDRLSLFRERVGGDRVRIEPLANEPLRIEATFRNLPGLGLVTVRRSTLRSDFAAGSHDRLMINLGGAALAGQLGREIELGKGDAVALRGADSGWYTTMSSGRIATVEFIEGGFAASLSAFATGGPRRIAGNSPALLLLRRYLNAICASGGFGSDQLGSTAAAHIQDLAALAVGANRDAGEIASRRGVRAARLREIKQDILARLGGEVALADVAARHGLSTRYVRMLFEKEGTSFSEFVREERLNRARRLLLSPRNHHRLISEIAYETGFNDLSYFNRSFRSRFDVTPSELRSALKTPEQLGSQD